MEEKGLTVQSHSMEISIEDVKKYIAPNATDKELFTFMGIARSYGLNPWKREIHWIKYGTNPGQTVVGYEMYLKRAEATGQLDGWEVTMLDMGEETERAKITIYRKDRSHPFVWEVYRREFDKKQSVWNTMPTFMLKKVAISQGFRLCFTEELGGMPYIPEEINSRSSEDLPQTPVEVMPDEQFDQTSRDAAIAYTGILDDYQGITTVEGLKNHPRAWPEVYEKIKGTEFVKKAREAYKARLKELGG